LCSEKGGGWVSGKAKVLLAPRGASAKFPRGGRGRNKHTSCIKEPGQNMKAQIPVLQEEGDVTLRKGTVLVCTTEPWSIPKTLQ